MGQIGLRDAQARYFSINAMIWYDILNVSCSAHWICKRGTMLIMRHSLG